MLSTAELSARFAKMGTPHKNGTTLPPGTPSLESDEVRTLFVSGLPMDVRLRELYLLFRCYELLNQPYLLSMNLPSTFPSSPHYHCFCVAAYVASLITTATLQGYEGSFLKLISSKPGKPPQPIAFVSFKTRKQAEQALEDLQGVRFDPASSQTLRLEFAHTNSRVSPRQPSVPSTPGYYPAFTPNKNGGCTYYMMPNPAVTQQSHQGMVGMGTDSWTPRVTMAYHNLSHVSTSPSPTLSPAPSHPHLSVLNILSDSDSSPAHSPTPTSGTPQPPSLSTTPCSTLFVANLELQHTEEEIASLFGSCRGFTKAKMFSRGGPPVAFVEFKDVECAAEAMEKLQGYVLVTSKRSSGIRIEYAKQRMGEPNRSPLTLDSSSPASPVQTIHSSIHPHASGGSPAHSLPGTPQPPSSLEFSPPHHQQPTMVSSGGFGTPISMVYSNGYSPQGQLFMNGFSSPIIPSWQIKHPEMQSN